MDEIDGLELIFEKPAADARPPGRHGEAMALRNRVTPFSELVADPARGSCTATAGASTTPMGRSCAATG